MIIKPEHFKNGGEVDCCVKSIKPVGRISIRKAPDTTHEPGMHLSEEYEQRYEAYRHISFPLRRVGKDEVLKRGSLAEVVAYTNELCGLEDTVEE